MLPLWTGNHGLGTDSTIYEQPHAAPQKALAVATDVCEDRAVIAVALSFPNAAPL